MPSPTLICTPDERGRDGVIVERSEENLAYWAKRFEYPLLAASVIGLIGMCLRVATANDHILHLLGNVLADAPWLVFFAEWLVLLSVAPNRGRFLVSHKFLTLIMISTPIALAANLITPLPGVVALSSVLRLAPLGRWLLNRRSLGYLFAFGLLVVLTATVGFWRVESTSFGEALYWSFTSATIGEEGPKATHPETIALMVVLGMLRGSFFFVLMGTLVTRIIHRDQAELENEMRRQVGEDIEEVEELIEEAAEQAEVDNEMLAGKIDALATSIDARLAAIEARLLAAKPALDS